ncbi:MAG TPA: MBOAT family O-acyltransferase [Burkholderiaceae bacterium]|jgi:alginate O-acetyltransferase complex protein AlgI
MLFNSFEFVYLFLPITLAGFFLLGRRNITIAAYWLALASLFFYGWAVPQFIVLLLGSVTFNFVAGRYIARAQPNSRSRRFLIGAIVANLLVLAVFKYARFFVASLNDLTGAALPVPAFVLPLGISFFTFTQIAFLIDSYRGLAREYSVAHYLLFVTYFPHLIAGPIIHHGQMMPQFAKRESYRLDFDNVGRGLSVFSWGMAKKMLFADTLASFADPVFGAASHGIMMGETSSWIGVLAYALQLYFDFSGYSDMAVGLSLMFNIELPINFNSPYKAGNIIEFWRRWHISLSQFLLNYLYIPLGGNRQGQIMRFINLMATMLIGGLWHGANWTFVLWGGIHGIYLVINHTWLSIIGEARLAALRRSLLYVIAMHGLTFACVVLAWIVFRADSLPAAWILIQGCLGQGGGFIYMPDIELPFLDVSSDQFIFFSLLVVWFMPNAQQMFGDAGDGSAQHIVLARRILKSPWGGFILGCILCIAIARFAKVSPFLYYQF